MTISKPNPQPSLIILVKEPKIGNVKTRLAKDLGFFEATKWFRHESGLTIRRLSQAPFWKTMLGVTPNHNYATSKIKIWLNRVERLPQGDGELGERFVYMARKILRGPVIMIGSDIPNIKIKHLVNAIRVLSSHDVVFGPSPDGGFWLIGFKHPQRHNRRQFAKVRWSTQHALRDCEDRLSQFTIGYINELGDIDTIQDLKRHSQMRVRYYC